MKKSKNKAGASVKVDPYLEGMMAKLVDRLIGLEKKLDIVINQTAGKSAISNGQQPKPPQASQLNQPPRQERTMYEAICADCSKVCEVPFRPVEGRAVYCKDCFAKRKAGGSGKGPMLTPVALRPKPVSKLNVPMAPIPTAAIASKKSKKSKPVKKAKKK